MLVRKLDRWEIVDGCWKMLTAGTAAILRKLQFGEVLCEQTAKVEAGGKGYWTS